MEALSNEMAAKARRIKVQGGDPSKQIAADLAQVIALLHCKTVCWLIVGDVVGIARDHASTIMGILTPIHVLSL